TMLVAALTTLLLAQAVPWAPRKPLGAAQLLWLAPTLWFCGAGAALALLTHSRSASGAALGGLWVAELVFHDTFAMTTWARPWFLFATLYTPSADFWLTNRSQLLGIAGVLLTLAWWYLHHAEWRFRGEEL
ncbi:MAG: hypothetical protein IVW57_17435, partial [Ktedonobacterales bacterium]|nr:hypothetical protein [Ktedonobacterales bacterium]